MRSKALRSLGIFIFTFLWFLAGWPRIFNLVPKIREAQAAIGGVAATPTGVTHTSSQTTSCANTQTAGFGTSTTHTVVIVVSLQPGGTVTGVTDNATGGSNSYSRLYVDYSLRAHDEIWYSVNIPRVNASGLVITAAFSGQRDSCVFKAYTGVVSAAAAPTSTNTGGSSRTPSITTVTTSPNSLIVSGISMGNGVQTASAKSGTLDANVTSGGTTTPGAAIVSSTTVTQGGSLTNSVTLSSSNYWAVTALELRSDLINPTVSPNGGSLNNDTSTTLQGSDAGATYCYTSGDGTQAAPTATSPGTCATGTTYSGAFNVIVTGTVLKVLATKSGWTNSAVTTSSAFTLTVADPAFGTNGGSFSNDTSTSFLSTTTGVVFCSTLDGSTPAAATAGTCSAGAIGSSATAIATGTTVKVLGTKTNYVNSSVQTSSAFTLTVGAITSSPGAGSYPGIQSVTLDIATTTSAVAHYTTDGSAVSCSSTTYSGSFNVSTTTTVKAIGCKSNYDSDTVISDLYTITVPAAPTNVAATDGTHTDKVTITWTKSTGATQYHVWRDATDLGAAGDVATFDDTGAGAPTIIAGSAVASDGTSGTQINLSLSGTSANNGTTYTYKVVASNAVGNSADSATNTGYRGSGSLTYQWQRTDTDSSGGTYSDIDGATGATYADTGAPVDGSGRYYKCILNATGVSQQTSAADRGYRFVISVTITTDGIVDYGGVAIGTNKSTIDLSDTQTVKNDGNVAEDLTIKTSNATGGTGWTLGASAGTNIFVHEFYTAAIGSWTKFSAADTYSATPLVTDLAVDGTQNFDLRLTAPTSSDPTQKSITVTILATKH